MSALFERPTADRAAQSRWMLMPRAESLLVVPEILSGRVAQRLTDPASNPDKENSQ